MAGRVLRDEELAFVSGQLAALTAREAPLGSGLRAMAVDAPSGPLREAVSRLADDVERGVSLSKAVQAQPHAFPELLAAAVEAGEASNSLPDVLSSFSRHCRMVSRLRARAWQAAAYPVVILVFSAALIAFILAYFLPHLRDVQRDAAGWWVHRWYFYSDMKDPRVSCVTMALYWVSDHLAVVALLAGVVGLLAAVALVRWWRKGALQKAWGWLMLRIPWTGRFVTSSLQARFCRTLGLLLKAGVPLPKALPLAVRSGQTGVLANGPEQVGELVQSGMALSTALASQKLFSDAFVWAIEMGEKRGNLPETLLDMADLYEEESEYAAGLLRALLPPVFFVAALPFIGSAVAAVMSPLFYMMRLVGFFSGSDERQRGPGDIIAWVVGLVLFYVVARCVSAWHGGTWRQRLRGFVTGHLSLITRRNLPLAAGLQMVATSAPKSYRVVLARLRSEVEAGQSLASAMARFPSCFPAAYVRMVEAGEANGNLAAIFEKLKTYDDAAIRFQRRATLAIVYPLTVLALLAGVLTGVVGFILPKYQLMYREMNVELPAVTKRVLATADSLHHAPLPQVVLLGLLAWLVLLVVLRHRSISVRRTLQALLSLFPGYARYVRDMAVARFCHTLSSLLDAGTSMVGALEAAASVRTGARIEKYLARLSQGAAEGRSLSSQMAAAGTFPSTFQWMVSVGEQSGELPRALARLADMYEASAGRMLTYMTRAIFPMLIVGMGLAEAFVVLAFFLPLVKIAGAIGTG